MVKVKFKYCDYLSHYEWKEQECICENVEQCIRWYGLGDDCDYEIISVEEI